MNPHLWKMETPHNQTTQKKHYHKNKDNMTELNELIYAGAKLVGEKIGIPSKSAKEKSKPGWEI